MKFVNVAEIIIAFSLALIFLWLLLTVVWGHEGEQWIADQQLLDPRTKQWCCGPSDCHVLADDAVRETADGWMVKEESDLAGEDIPYDRGLPVSPDGHYHRCGGRHMVPWSMKFIFETRCFIVPMRSS